MNTKIKYGLIGAAGAILLSLVIFILGLDKSEAGQYLNWLSAVILIIVMVMAIKERRVNELGGFISFKTAFSTSVVVAVVDTAVSSLYTYFYFTLINPGMIEFIAQKQVEKMEESGMEAEQIDAAMKMSEAWMTPGMMTMWTLVMGLFFGVILALIVSAIMKKPNPQEVS